MYPDDAKAQPYSIPEPHIAHDVVMGIVRNHVRNSIAPIGLKVDCSYLRSWAERAQLERFRYQSLIKELQAWGPFFSKRPVSLICIKSPFCILDAPGLTELMFAIGQNLKLIQGHHVEHAVTLQVDHITRENIALLKGLTFNHIYIQISAHIELDQLRQLYSQILEFRIEKISIITEFSETDTNPLGRLMDVLSCIKPETLCFKAPPPSLFRMAPEAVTSVLTKMGYYLHNNQCLIRFHSGLHSRPEDTLQLGPGTSSTIGALHTTNFNEPGAYANRINKGNLPVAALR